MSGPRPRQRRMHRKFRCRTILERCWPIEYGTVSSGLGQICFWRSLQWLKLALGDLRVSLEAAIVGMLCLRSVVLGSMASMRMKLVADTSL